MLEARNGIRGKVCSTCRLWKPLDAFSTDPTHPASQGGRHCRCKECHRKIATKKRAAAQRIGSAISVLAVLLFLSGVAASKEKPTYQTGKLIDLSVQDVTRGIGVVGGMAAPIPGKLYVFQIQLDDLVYFAEYRAGKLSYKPEWIVNDPIEFRFGKEDKAFLKRPDGKELEVVIVKKIRQQ
ncbi:MAG: hypothetical protein LAO24_00555 [Acidobacteriia bacterium]|nr:hypothetical protein [Terriglobia bacterium]